MEEDLQGIPFVGRAGKLLTKIIESIGLKRKEVYIANILKCRPPQNRNPLPAEILTCEGFLIRQIGLIKPKVICTLGKFAAQTLLRSTESISRIRGKFYDYHGAKLIPTFHPAYLLQECHTVNIGHDIIQDDDIGFFFSEGIHRYVAVYAVGHGGQ